MILTKTCLEFLITLNGPPQKNGASVRSDVVHGGWFGNLICLRRPYHAALTPLIKVKSMSCYRYLISNGFLASPWPPNFSYQIPFRSGRAFKTLQTRMSGHGFF